MMRTAGRIAGGPSGRFLGYVQVQVGSRMYSLPIEARSLTLEDGSTVEPGFSVEGADRLRIVVDKEASETVVQQTIERASAEAARHISRKVLN